MEQPSPDQIFLPAADPRFSLADEQRAKVPTGANADALEKLMARVRPDFRDGFLEEVRTFHQDMRHGGKIAPGPLVINAGDAEIERLLREVFRLQ